MSSRSPRPPPRRCRRRLPRPSCCCCCCRRSHLNEDTGRFVLLAALIGLYLVAGATVFSALESPGEAEARARWGATLRNFSAAHGVAEPELRAFLRHYEAALAAGVRADALRPRWDFPGAFYFVGTVVSTIGERAARPARLSSARLSLAALSIDLGLGPLLTPFAYFGLALRPLVLLLFFPSLGGARGGPNGPSLALIYQLSLVCQPGAERLKRSMSRLCSLVLSSVRGFVRTCVKGCYFPPYSALTTLSG